MPMHLFQFSCRGNPRFSLNLFVLLVGLISLSVSAQTSDPKSPPVLVQPGAPGQPTKILPASTRAKLPPRSAKDVEFMQGMITHHAQAIEMTELIRARTENKDLRMVGARITKSQIDEIGFMKRWLEARGEPSSPSMEGMSGHSMDH